MHITTRPVASVQNDEEYRDYNILCKKQLIASTTNPFHAITAVINLQLREEFHLELRNVR